MDYSNMQNIPVKKNLALVSSAFIFGILSLISAFTCFSFLAPVFGGLGILFALLSRGKEEVFEKKAKQGLVMSAISFASTMIFSLIAIVISVVTISQYEPDELHNYLNEAYEETYGQSFDELYEEIYGEDFNDVYKELYGDF